MSISTKSDPSGLSPSAGQPRMTWVWLGRLTFRRAELPLNQPRFILAHKENNMKEDARKNWRRRKRQKRRLATRKYMADKKSKTV